MRDFNIDFFPHPEIVTFAQTRDAVYYSRRAPNGALVPLPDSAGVDSADADSSAAAPAPAPAPAPGVPKRRIVWDPPTAARHAHATATASRRRQRDSDAELLARFALSRQKAQREVDLKKAARECVLLILEFLADNWLRRLKAKKLAGSEATQLPSGTHK
jgi:hypothetical protein